MKEQGMTVIVKTITRIVVGFITIFGAYVVLTGHLTPGGGFPGGVILACSFVLLTLAYGGETALRKMSERLSEALDSFWSLVFLIVALLGFVGGYFFLNFIAKGRPFHILSAGIIPVCNIAIGMKIAASIFGVFIALAMFMIIESSREER
jgi:multicomponent Na+:H+ antiporter subunit B